LTKGSDKKNLYDFLCISLRLFAAIPVFAFPSKLIAGIASAAIGTNQAISGNVPL